MRDLNVPRRVRFGGPAPVDGLERCCSILIGCLGSMLGARLLCSPAPVDQLGGVVLLGIAWCAVLPLLWRG